MAQDINYSLEQNDGMTGNITYRWYCWDCQEYHHEQFCPKNYPSNFNIRVEVDMVNKRIFIGKTRYDLCPHCGHLVKREV